MCRLWGEAAQYSPDFRRREYNPMAMPSADREQLPAKTLRLGPFGAAVAVFVLISLILAAIFCAFPWGMKVP